MPRQVLAATLIVGGADLMRLIDLYRHLCAIPTQQAEINYLFGILGVLDSKASALMRFDAIMIAAASFLLAGGHALPITPPLEAVLVSILVASLLAAGLCLFVVQISYPFLGKVRVIGTVVNLGREVSITQIDCMSEINSLNNAAERRSRYYRAAWWLSVTAVVLFLIFGIAILRA
jgi:hypothetical protein